MWFYMFFTSYCFFFSCCVICLNSLSDFEDLKICLQHLQFWLSLSGEPATLIDKFHSNLERLLVTNSHQLLCEILFVVYCAYF